MSRCPPVFALLLAAGLPVATAGEGPSYNQDIRPILVENCFGCHGADSAHRAADLRLDVRDDAVESGAIVPGDSDSSAMLDRICSDDPDEVMPPPAAKKTLSAEQKALLERWITAGAEYEPHWSFIPPKRPDLPAVKNETWVKTPIDRFILARLEAEGLAPAPEADRRTLARRVALDLTGLPPEPAVVEAFVADTHPDAYERLVDSLLASLEWGEHRGRHWLDYARYADTHGIHFDNFREMWTYRQWVINAFNRNLPFDQFTILQLAGDLVEHDASRATPHEVLDAKIASGFNRCNMTTNEGGVIPDVPSATTTSSIRCRRRSSTSSRRSSTTRPRTRWTATSTIRRRSCPCPPSPTASDGRRSSGSSRRRGGRWGLSAKGRASHSQPGSRR
jgi:hypothetical protein